MKPKIGVIYGGFSNEREVSLRSGKAIAEALEKKGYEVTLIDPATTPNWLEGYDVAFIALHGKFGEDGTIQTLLENAKIPYIGSDVNANVRCFNKAVCKTLLKTNHLPTPNFLIGHEPLSHLPESFYFPVILKPLEGGSSVDTTIADTQEDLKEQTLYLCQKYHNFILEPYIENNTEISIGIIENPDPIALPILELRPQNRFYDYDAKYTKGKTEFILPAEISDETTQKAKEIALEAHKLMGCRSMSRVDMIVNDNGEPFIIDINTIPGFTETSDLPAQAKEAGMSFEDLVEILAKTSE